MSLLSVTYAHNFNMLRVNNHVMTFMSFIYYVHNCFQSILMAGPRPAHIVLHIVDVVRNETINRCMRCFP